jgi:hypothetical protein
METHRVVLTTGSQMVMRLSASCTGHALLPINIIFLLLVLICVIGWVNPQDLACLDGLRKLTKFNCLIGVSNSQALSLQDSASATIIPCASYQIYQDLQMLCGTIPIQCTMNTIKAHSAVSRVKLRVITQRKAIHCSTSI